MGATGSYLDYAKRADVLSGGATRIPVNTPAGTYQVWVKRIGNNPSLRVLLLHGGPGSTHEYLEACDSFVLYGQSWGGSSPSSTRLPTSTTCAVWSSPT